MTPPPPPSPLPKKKTQTLFIIRSLIWRSSCDGVFLYCNCFVQCMEFRSELSEYIRHHLICAIYPRGVSHCPLVPTTNVTSNIHTLLYYLKCKSLYNVEEPNEQMEYNIIGTGNHQGCDRFYMRQHESKFL